MPTPTSSSFRSPTLSRQATLLHGGGMRWNSMIAQALLTAVAVVILLFLVLAALMSFSSTPSLSSLPRREESTLTYTPSSSDNDSTAPTATSLASSAPAPPVPALGGSTLEYYVHVEIEAPNLAGLLPPANATRSASFGTMQLFAFNVTEGDESTSAVIGVMRGYTLQSAYVQGQSFLVEVEVLEYDNASTGVNGTISIQGIVLNAPSTLAVAGGTGHFYGARGSVYIQQATSTLYHHTIRFL